MFANENSVLPQLPGVPAEPVFFINSAGKVLNESRVSARVINMGKKLAPSAGPIRGVRIRKAIISLNQDQGETSTISKEHLAKQMTQSVSTSDRNYNVRTTADEDAEVATFISSVQGKGKWEGTERKGKERKAVEKRELEKDAKGKEEQEGDEKKGDDEYEEKGETREGMIRRGGR